MSETRTPKEQVKALEARMQCILHLLDRASNAQVDYPTPGDIRRARAYIDRARLVANGMSEDEMWETTRNEVTA